MTVRPLKFLIFKSSIKSSYKSSYKSPIRLPQDKKIKKSTAFTGIKGA